MFRYHSIAPERIKEESQSVSGLDQKRYKYKSKQAALLFRIIFTQLTQAHNYTTTTTKLIPLNNFVLVWMRTIKKNVNKWLFSTE
jgi:hypothetical protein